MNARFQPFGLCAALLLASAGLGQDLTLGSHDAPAAVAERGPAPPGFTPAPLRPEPGASRGSGRSAAAGEFKVEYPGPFAPLPQRWAGDVLVTDRDYDQVEPTMDRAPDGHLYLAVEERGGESEGWIRIWRSTDDGATWSWWLMIWAGGETRNPALAVAQNSAGEDWLFLAYYVPSQGQIGLFRHRLGGSGSDFVNVSDGVAADDVRPQICTDNSLWDTYYIYLTWTVNAIDYYPAMFSRSLDYGLTWSAPQNLTGGAENSGWVTCPDIAFGTAGLFVAYEELGWNGSTWENQVWVTNSTNYGASWSSPVQLSTAPLGTYHPSVAAAVGGNTVMVAYTRVYSSDTDIHCSYSTDGGANWSAEYSLPWTFDDEKTVQLAASAAPGGRFHAAYWLDYDVKYTWSDVTTPASWAPAVTLNEANWFSSVYTRPTVCVDPARPPAYEAAVAWTDYRGPFYQAYFDALYRGCAGDLNCDGQVDFGDINPFVLHLSNLAVWEATYPGCNAYNGDINGDGEYAEFGDINPFVALLSSGGLPIDCAP